MNGTVIGIISVIAFIILGPVIGGLLDGIDRKLSARMQGRKGPSVLQPFYDVKKLLQKELLVVNHFQLFMVFAYLIFIILTGALFFFGADLLLCFIALSTAAMFLILASTSTHSPFSTVGAHRELMQMMSYEPMVLLVAVGFYLATGSFRVSDIILCDSPAIICTPGFFVGFLFILTIKMRKSPFDLSTSHHAHQEVVKGVTTEMVGVDYACIIISEWYENVFLLGVVGLFCIWSNPLSILLAIVVILATYFLEVLIDNTCARVKWDLMFKAAWTVTIIAGGVNMLILQFIR